MYPNRSIPLAVLVFVVAAAASACADDIVVADFEGPDYGDWTATGEAFGPGPARGTLPNQMPVSGYHGEGLVNTYFHGDDTQGTLTSPEFLVQRMRINFLIGGGGHAGETCINLLIDGKAVRTATGTSLQAGGSERLRSHSWDVAEFAGKTARLEIVDRRSGGWGHINVDQIVQSDNKPLPDDERRELLARANESVRQAAARVKGDPLRPIYHVLPPANWMNDPNGPLFYKGYYHLFYQHNPYGDEWGHMHWGHVRSRDLAHWEHLPIALWPSESLGEDHVFSGCAAVNSLGQPMLFYTSIGGRLPEQWAALPEDDELILWKKHPANPVMTELLHGNVKVHEWRDPFHFRAEDRDYMVLGGNLNGSQGGQGVVNVYRAENGELTQWKYLGVLFQHPDAAVKNVECPLFFPLDDRWVLITSQGQPVHYFVGELDAQTMRFTPRQRGEIDFGTYYAPNCLQEESGRRLLWGWVTGYASGRGWRHCLTLPRVLSLLPDGALAQHPAPELEKLRGEHRLENVVELTDRSRRLKTRGNSLEILAEFEPDGAKSLGVRVLCSADGSRASTVRWDGSQLDVAGTLAPLELLPGESSVRLHIFVDRSLIEVYANDRRCVARVVTPEPDDQGVEVFAEGGGARLKSMESWDLGSAWVGN